MIKDKFNSKTPLLSFEVFPPKKEGEFETAQETLQALSKLNPDFISVTYGAGGSKSKKTLEIASYIQNELKIDSIAHLTCVGQTQTELDSILKEFEKEGISQILALRGDRPFTMTDEQFNNRDFFYASDLIQYINKEKNFHLVGACYPEKHYEALSLEDDILHLKHKIECGVDFLITQLFFDNKLFYHYRELLDKHNISIPICTGIMPITTAKQLGTTVSLSGSSVPKELSDIIATYGDHKDDMRKAGIDYAIRQIKDLKENGVDGIHLYTMNKPKMATEIITNI